MEKLMYIIWKKSGETAENFRDAIIQSTTTGLEQCGAQKIRLTILDNDVAPANKLQLISVYLKETYIIPDGVISFWLNSAQCRQDAEKNLMDACFAINGYLVTESEPLSNKKFPAVHGQRTHGMNQVVFLKKPDRLTREEWLDNWLNKHTQIAIRTQSTFGYRQNVVVRALTENSLKIDAIVEENFPAEAMTSRHAFYNAEGNDALLKKNQSEMLASIQRFIDFDKIDCLPMSEYSF